MGTITIAFEEYEEDRRRRQLRRRLPILLAAALGAMVLLATDDERPPIIRTVVKPVPVRVEVPVPVRVEVLVPTEVLGPPKPIIVVREVVKKPAPPPVVVATTTTAPPPQAPPPVQELLEPSITPSSITFMSSHWERALISNPHAVPIRITSIDATGLRGASVNGYRIDSRKCVGTLAPGKSCTITVFARELAIRARETIQIKVTTAPQ